MKARIAVLAVAAALLALFVLPCLADDPAPAKTAGDLITASEGAHADLDAKTKAAADAEKALADAQASAQATDAALVSDLVANGPVVKLADPPVLYEATSDGKGFVARPIRSTNTPIAPAPPPAAAPPRKAATVPRASHSLRQRYPYSTDAQIARMERARTDRASPGR